MRGLQLKSVLVGAAAVVLLIKFGPRIGLGGLTSKLG